MLVFGVVYGHGFDVLGVMGSSPPGTFPVTHQQQLEAHIPQLVLSVCLWGVALLWIGCVGVGGCLFPCVSWLGVVAFCIALPLPGTTTNG